MLSLDEPIIEAPPAALASSLSSRPRLSTPIVIDSPCDCCTSQPVTVGIPFAKGKLRQPKSLVLIACDGSPRPIQTHVTARWSDGSVRWLLIDFVVDSVRRGRQAWHLADVADVCAVSRPQAMAAGESESAFDVHTGTASFRVNRRELQPFARVVLSRSDVIDPAGTRVVLTDAQGREQLARVQRSEIESRGPVRTTLRLEGTWTGRTGLRFVARISFYAGTGLVRLALTLHNPQRARHRGGLWDLGDAGAVLFRDLSVETTLKCPREPQVEWTTGPGQARRSLLDGDRLTIYQDSSGGENWNSRNHVNRDGRVPCSFRGFELQYGDCSERGRRASPVVSVGTEEMRLAAAVPEFWQQFPKAISVHGPRLRVQLFPGRFADLHELQGGEQKTHTVWLHFDSPDDPTESTTLPLDWVHQPACVHTSPQWYAESLAVPYLTPSLAGCATPYEPLMAKVVRGPRSLFDRRESIDEYGWRNFGDVWADHEEAYCDAVRPVISHYNNQYDMIAGFVANYLRTGDRAWFDLLDPLARHVIDIDIYHTDRDKAAYNGGLFWHTAHYRDAATSTHRCYSRHMRSAGAGQLFGGGPCNEHNYTTGLAYYHFLTGEPAARDAVIGLADWVVRMDDGRRTILGWIDAGPTGLASQTTQPNYHGPGRGCGNSINALLDAWLLTGRGCYIAKAEELIRRSIHPADDVGSRNLLDVENRWSYTVFLAAIARFLDVRAESGATDETYAYARAALVHYAAWMADNERPYFDRPEQLEYPTETWAAQDLRKANVLCMASRYADGPLRTRLLDRGRELADRAWADWQRFDSRDVARAVAILMTEGMRDACFRARCGDALLPIAPGAAALANDQFGSPASFRSQRDRVLGWLKP
jgi:hypothetical protein